MTYIDIRHNQNVRLPVVLRLSFKNEVPSHFHPVSKMEVCGVLSFLFCFFFFFFNRQELIEATVLCSEEAFLEKGMITVLNLTIKFGHFC